MKRTYIRTCDFSAAERILPDAALGYQQRVALATGDWWFNAGREEEEEEENRGGGGGREEQILGVCMSPVPEGGCVLDEQGRAQLFLEPETTPPPQSKYRHSQQGK